MQNTLNEWRAAVKSVGLRRSLVNYELGLRIVDVLKYKELYGPELGVLDVHSGPAVLSAAVFNKLRPKKQLMFEPLLAYRKFLTHLSETTSGLLYERNDPFRWATYTEAYEKFDFHPPTVERTKVNDKLLFVGNMLHSQGEQLIAQYLNCISNQSWIQRFGRVRMLLLMQPETALKLCALPNEQARHRITAQRESCCEVRVVAHVHNKKQGDNYPSRLLNPLIPTKDIDLKQDFLPATHGVSILELTPHEHQVKHIDEFEYVILRLFMRRTKPLSHSIDSLGPGALEDLGPQLKDLLDRPVCSMNIEELYRITEAFWRWPFKPDHLIEYYDDGRHL